MTTGHAVTRKWGNSIGIILPKELVDKENIGVNEEITFLIVPKKNPLKKWFGKIQFEKSAQEMKDDIRRELY